ncbi:MAG: hypothetical protein K2J15_05610 [Muribaculaceae bacterium]|nr:hypothetical protein [Muribaculaceae bacterium]
MKIKKLILSLACFGTCAFASAGPVMLNARLDSAVMLMGNVNTLHLEVVQDKNIKGHFPLFEKFGPEGIVTLLNDTIELRYPVKLDTTEVGSGRIQINYEIPVQVFDSGYYKLPDIEFVAGKDTVRSKELLLTVNPVQVTADDPISPFTDVSEPENPSIFDQVPDWLYYYWWIYLLAACLIAGGIYFWKRYRKEGTILPKKPEKTPYQQAMEDLQRLKARKLWESGREKEYYTELTEILRKYLDGRFGIQAMEMTSSEIMNRLADLGDHDIPRDKMRDVLDMADFVKFAMVRPLPDDNVALFKNAVDFVESTRPVDNSNDDMPTSADDKGAGTDKKISQDMSKRSDESAETMERSVYRGVGRRGRMARLDDTPDRISAARMKVGKKINRREVFSRSEDKKSKFGNNGQRREVNQ